MDPLQAVMSGTQHQETGPPLSLVTWGHCVSWSQAELRTGPQAPLADPPLPAIPPHKDPACLSSLLKAHPEAEGVEMP